VAARIFQLRKKLSTSFLNSRELFLRQKDSRDI